MSGTRASILFCSVLLIGCQNSEQVTTIEPAHNPRICEPVPIQGKGQWGACVHRIAYKYARAADPAEVVAKAVSTSCGEPVAEILNSTPKEKRIELLAQINQSMESFALSKVIEARAGHCEVPE